MVKPLDIDNVESVKSFLRESLKDVISVSEEVRPESAKLVQSLEDHDGEFLSQYNSAKEFMEEIIKELDTAIEQKRQISALDLFVGQLYLVCRKLSEDNDLKESFMDNIKKFYKATENSKLLKGLMPRLAIFGAEAISPELGQLVHMFFASQDKK